MRDRVLRDRQLAVPPLGDLVAVPERDVVYLSALSGSTGVPTASLLPAGSLPRATHKAKRVEDRRASLWT